MVVDPAIIERWRGVDRLIVVDAVASGAAPGTVHCFNLNRESLPGDLSFCSSHAFGLAALLNLARALDRLPPQAWVFGVEAHDFTPGQAVSETVLLGVTACVKAIVDFLNNETE
jgi:hydrogenase maturation protease